SRRREPRTAHPGLPAPQARAGGERQRGRRRLRLRHDGSARTRVPVGGRPRRTRTTRRRSRDPRRPLLRDGARRVGPGGLARARQPAHGARGVVGGTRRRFERRRGPARHEPRRHARGGERRPARPAAAPRPHRAPPHGRVVPRRRERRAGRGLRARRLAARQDGRGAATRPAVRLCGGVTAMTMATIRVLEERDADRAGDVNFLAFYDVALRHGQTPVVTTPADARSYVRHLLSFDPLGGLVAELDGGIVGMAWLHQRRPVGTIGPVAVTPRVQGRGIGRLLLERCIEAAGPRIPQVRLVHESFNTRSLGLYLRTGFRVVSPLVELELAPGAAVLGVGPSGARVRAAGATDRPRLVERDARAFGAPRPQSIDLYLRSGRALVAERGSALAGYAFGIGLGPVGDLLSASAGRLPGVAR